MALIDSSSDGGTSMNTVAKRAKLIEILEVTMSLAETLGDSTTMYLIERALDDARSKQGPSLVPSERLH
jgi:hypothetical protein